ncbi:MAG: pyridoxamine 5'-phosphate oxidase family protein [Proteobacteria bacterium]|nr:pyridoxamine 5'-phosphate oxidase family protein [Pseudomonadota bacterium]MBU1585624.1 pyridoxamine 5'-phosphate oxidase family protein [Pseudomonadota bacterium]MBU2453318.1 pyridoxamine 5'-phosphate oxidase family protein [Pseudomonadota bacterium]MBU2631590.1 pyridoxamine 5'-phosphate oxidase family protein [Pseudomonadota bacterium]
MRRKEKEIINRQDIEKILWGASICRLAMVDGNTPYMVPMNFGYKDGVLYFHSAPEGRKIDLIKINPNVCFEVDQLIRFKKAKLACDWGIIYKSVIGSGKAQLLDTPQEKEAALDIIMSQYSGRKFEYPAKMLEKTIVIKVTIDRMTGKQS